jgi:glutamate dehydrogenase (NADP+)
MKPTPGKKPWAVVDTLDAAYPSACENEINKSEAEVLVSKGCKMISEGKT